MNDGMVQLNKVTKTYGTFQLDCSMEVFPGMATGFVGANGAGKTTTFQILLGLVPPETGGIRIFGKTYTELTAKDRERIGVSLADSGFSQFLTVRDVTAILRNLYTRFDEDRFLEKCQRYELPANKKIKDFSTGMQAKLKLLIAMSHDADLLILDEPTLGLDVMSREAMLEELQEYLDSEGTGGAPRSVLISSHISSDLEKFCDDIYMIDRGKIVLHEETDVLLDSYGILKVDERQYQALDRRYLLAGMREAYGYRLLTNERRYYQENYPDLVMEKGSIDDILIAAIFLCSGQPAQIIVGYCTMFGMLFTVNTISYDEFDHGYLFLFTLPVTRKDYVLEKYAFMLLCGGGFWAASAAAGFVADYIRGDVTSLLEWLMPMFLILLEMTIFLAVMLPVSLKYGMEKSRTATMILGFAVLGAAIAARKLLPEDFAGGLRWSAQLNPAAVTAVVFLVSLITLAVSFAGSVRIMQKKVF